jgi:8-oxo-dGTP pyrophosphatase MutT (NUDIX family)
MIPKSKRTELDLPKMRWMNRAAVHEFDLANGERGRWESLCSPADKHSVLVVALTPDKKLVLVRQYRFPVESFAVELPGGVVDPGESASEAVGRELLQETGYATDEV